MKAPSRCTLDELRPYASEYARRLRLGKATTPRKLSPCPDCGAMVGVREARYEHPKVCLARK